MYKRAVRSPWSMRCFVCAATDGLAWSATPLPASCSIDRSLAPSPTARASSQARCRCGWLLEGTRASALAWRPRMGSSNKSGKRAVFLNQHIGLIFIKAEHGGDRSGETGEAAGDQCGVAAVFLHRGNQLPAAGCQRDAIADNICDDADLQSFQQRDAFAQGGLERDFAVHGTGGYGRDMLFQADHIGELVNALLTDHGGIHVGDQQLLAAAVMILNDDIDRLAGHGGAKQPKPSLHPILRPAASPPQCHRRASRACRAPIA